MCRRGFEIEGEGIARRKFGRGLVVPGRGYQQCGEGLGELPGEGINPGARGGGWVRARARGTGGRGFVSAAAWARVGGRAMAKGRGDRIQGRGSQGREARG